MAYIRMTGGSGSNIRYGTAVKRENQSTAVNTFSAPYSGKYVLMISADNFNAQPYTISITKSGLTVETYTITAGYRRTPTPLEINLNTGDVLTFTVSLPSGGSYLNESFVCFYAV